MSKYTLKKEKMTKSDKNINFALKNYSDVL